MSNAKIPWTAHADLFSCEAVQIVLMCEVAHLLKCDPGDVTLEMEGFESIEVSTPEGTFVIRDEDSLKTYITDAADDYADCLESEHIPQGASQYLIIDNAAIERDFWIERYEIAQIKDEFFVDMPLTPSHHEMNFKTLWFCLCEA